MGVHEGARQGVDEVTCANVGLSNETIIEHESG